ncbi:MAG: RluA family pseudouridine synthase [bacterium]|nr:RluA family pseudouridine synthase [bacterium]
MSFSLNQDQYEVFKLEVVRPSRLDQFLSSSDIQLSRARCNQLIEDGRVSVNGKIVRKKSYKLNVGQSVTLELPPPISIETPAEDLGINIIYEDADLLILEKPPGILTHPLFDGQGGSMVSAALHLANKLSGINGKLRPGVVHRLDRETSGVLVMAKNDFAHKHLQQDFHDRKVKKTYFAIAYGDPSEWMGKIDLPLARNPKKRMLRKIDDSGRSALTIFRIIKSWQRFHLVHLMPHTGRTHQLRVHMKSIGIPIIQDLDYNGRSLSRWVNRVQLHHFSIKIFHPRTGEKMLFRCPLLADMRELISRLQQGDVYPWSY